MSYQLRFKEIGGTPPQQLKNIKHVNTKHLKIKQRL